LPKCAATRAPRSAACCPDGSAKSPRWRNAPSSAPGRRPEAIRARLAEQVATLLAQSDRFDPDRLHQEAILIATKADVREELDRLARMSRRRSSHRRRAEPIGRRLDFLAQELNREANTLVRQGERCRTHQYRLGAQGGGRAIPRAGAERGIENVE
jgi:hypothetical protein